MSAACLSLYSLRLQVGLGYPLSIYTLTVGGVAGSRVLFVIV